MPLIIISGYPTSGKTHRAKQLLSNFQARIAAAPADSKIAKLRTHHISDDTLHISRRVYDLESKNVNERSNNASEKDARATLFAAVKRVLSEGDIVVLDAGNYIKGWRYQLFCEAKAVRTGCCVLHVGTTAEKAKSVNEARLAARDAAASKGVNDEEATEAYEPDCWENLVFRFEEPNGMVRWDSPLFTVVWDDEVPPADEMWEVLVDKPEGKKGVMRPNAATVLKPATTENYLYELDKRTQEVLAKILEWTRDHPEGGGVVSCGGGLDIELPGNPVALPALQRLRRQFIALNRRDTVSATRIAEAFVGYLNDAFQNDKRADGKSENSALKTDLPVTDGPAHAVASDYIEETQSTSLNQDQRGNSQDDPLVIADEPYSECCNTEDEGEDEHINTAQDNQNEPLRSHSPYYDTAPQPKIALLSTKDLFDIDIELASTQERDLSPTKQLDPLSPLVQDHTGPLTFSPEISRDQTSHLLKNEVNVDVLTELGCPS